MNFKHLKFSMYEKHQIKLKPGETTNSSDYIYISWKFRHLQINDVCWGKIQEKKVTADFPL